MNYPDAITQLRELGRFGIGLGPQRTEALLSELGTPQRQLWGALVGGTNGKGSVIALVQSVLTRAGLSVGAMPKPHLVSYRERVQIGGRPISADAFAAAITRAMGVAGRIAPKFGAATEFEIVTAAGIDELARSSVDVALVEVGMGGRLDATNCLDLGVAAITNVQHDHERYLGRTLSHIGAEKAAIIKQKNEVVTGAHGDGLGAILDRCADLGLSVRRAGRDGSYRARVRECGWGGLVVDAVTPSARLPNLQLGLLGDHQAQNAAVALAVLDALAVKGAERGVSLRLHEEVVREGMWAARWPGRLEVIEHERLGWVVLDGAHNPAGAAALAKALRSLGASRMPMIFGAMRDKHVTEVLRAVARLEPRPVFTSVEDPRAVPPERLLRIWHQIAPSGSRGRVARHIALALEMAAETPAAGLILATGSLYLVGAVRDVLLGGSDPSSLS